MSQIANYFFDIVGKLKSPWAIIGAVGMICFSSRFLVQWIASEKKKQSVIPVSFWYLSIIGSVLLLAYGLFYVRDPFFILGYLFNSLVYFRNLYFIYKKGAV